MAKSEQRALGGRVRAGGPYPCLYWGWGLIFKEWWKAPVSCTSWPIMGTAADQSKQESNVYNLMVAGTFHTVPFHKGHRFRAVSQPKGLVSGASFLRSHL